MPGPPIVATEVRVRRRDLALRTITFGFGMLTLAVACSSGHATTANTTTTSGSSATSTTSNPNDTPNSIPYVVGEKIGLPNGWLVTVTAVHLHFSRSGLPPVHAAQQYVAIDIGMENQGPGTYTVNADRLFTLVDTSHQEHFVVAQPGTANGIDGPYPAGTTRSGRLVFTAPTGENLGLVLYGPRIGTQISDFTIVPPTVTSS